MHLDSLDNPKIPSSLSKLKSLELLTLRNDLLIAVPPSISQLEKLQVLDVSGNDFEKIPTSFSHLQCLEEIYLENERQLDFGQAFVILGKLPTLKSLHLERNPIHLLPKRINHFVTLEKLYINDRLFSGKSIKNDYFEFVRRVDLKLKNKVRRIETPQTAAIKIKF